MEQTPLFDRLGGRDGMRALCEKAVANHFANPLIKTRFEHAPMSSAEMVDSAVEFFCTGLTGVETYTGRDLAEAHTGMNVTDEEFCAALDDIMEALDSVGVEDPARSEVLGILYGMKPAVVRQ